MTQNVEKHLSILENRLQIDKKSSNDNYKLGQLYLQKKIYTRAITLFRNSLQYWDKNDKIGLGSLYNTLGFTYFKLKQYEPAEYYYIQAINLLPDYTLALTNLGLVYENRQMYKDAFKAYSGVLKYESKNKITLSRISSIKSKLDLEF